MASSTGTDLDRAKEYTRAYHQRYYGEHRLFQPGSWLHAHDPAIDAIGALVEGKTGLRALDLGCGVGRNAIPLARLTGARVDCVDELPLAISLLEEYAREHEVSETIYGIRRSIEDFAIAPQHYDMILAISVLEHCRDHEAMSRIIRDCIAGTTPGGIHRLTFSTHRTVTDALTEELLDSPVEMKTTLDGVRDLLSLHYAGWQTLEFEVKRYSEECQVSGRAAVWSSLEVNFMARLLE